MNVSSGGTASGTAVAGGTMNVSSGGTADTTSVSSGGTMNVSSGGTASGVSVGNGGTLNVSSGGVVSALTINDKNDRSVSAGSQCPVRRHCRRQYQDQRRNTDIGRRCGLSTTCCADDRQQWLAAARTGLVQRHHQRLRRIGHLGPGQDQVHRPRDDRDLYANMGRAYFRSQTGPTQSTFTWPAPTRPRTSRSRAMERTARWLLLSPMPRWRGTAS